MPGFVGTALSDFVEWVLLRMGRRFRPSYFEVVAEGPYRIELDSSFGRFVFDARRRVVSRDGRPLVGFDEIKFIDLVRPGDDHGWRIDLYISHFNRLTVGDSPDDVFISSLGAKLHTVTGVKLLAWK